MRTSVLSLLLIGTALPGCTVGPDYQPPAMGLTPQFMAADAIAPTQSDAEWWAGFDDPILIMLVGKAVAGNTDLAQARARIEQSRATARRAGLALLPTLDADGDASTNSISRETPVGRVTQVLGFPRGYDAYSVGAQASWEIDVFGGLRRGREAARADLGASEADAGAVAVAISAETADAYLTLRGQQARLAVAADQAKNEELLADLVGQRFREGLAAERELNRSVASLASVRAAMAPLRASIAAQLNRLDVLIGEQPGSNRALLIEPKPVPTAPMPAGSSSPTDLLRRRPDVIAAERRLAAADARIGVSMAEYYPHLSLSGLLGVASVGTSGLLTGSAVQASGAVGLRWRLFDFGRVDAEVAAARGREAEALAAWRGSVLSAAEDVETTLSRLLETKTERASLLIQVDALTKSRRQAQDAYREGIVGLIEVTDANRELLAATDRLAVVTAEEARGAVAAYRALGGGWDSGQAATRIAARR